MIPDGIRRAFRLPASRAGLARELDEEVRFHVEQRIADLVARGMTPDDARAEALRRFGDADDLHNYCDSLETSRMRRLRVRDWFESVNQDFHFALRQVRRSPGFAGLVVLTLALGLGATTAIFTVVDGVLLRPLPYPDAGRIVQLWEVGTDGGQMQVADPNFADVRDQSRSFSAVAQVASRGIVSVAGTAEPVRARAAMVSRDFFAVMGYQPEAGRLFAANELHPGGALAVIVSHAFAERQLGGSEAAVNRQLRMAGASFAVVGVMPAELDFPAGTELWAPREIDQPLPSRSAHNWQVVARLASGVARDQAQSDVSAIARRLKQQFGEETMMSDVAIVPLREELVGETRQPLLLLLGASAVLLLIALANVANLLIARMSSRRGEVAVRLALGAARGRIVQQFLVESLLLSLAAGAVGLGLAQLGVMALGALQPANLPRANDIGINWTIMLFAVAASVVVAIALGASSAWRSNRANLRDQLAQGQRTLSGPGSRHRLRAALVVAQVALTLVLLVGADLLGRSFGRLLSVDPGFRTDSGIVLDIAAEMGSAAERARLFDELGTRLRAIPGVTSVSATNSVPLAPGNFGNGYFAVMSRLDEPMSMEIFSQLVRNPERMGEAEFRVVGPGYFTAIRIPVIAGREFSEGDAAEAPHVAVVSASLAKARWAGGNPIGKIVQFGNMDGNLTPFTVVGVVGDVRERSLASEPRPTFYATYRQRPVRTAQFNLVMMHDGPAPAIIAAARQVLRELRPDIPPRFRVMDEIVGASVADRRFSLFLVGVFGGVALLLATLGVYSVISYLVTQRARDISIRIALGAQRGNVAGHVLAQGVALTVFGIVIGTVGAVAAARLIRGLLFNVSATDPASFATVIAVLVGVALAASYLPARRAARVEPMGVLRN